MDAPSLFASLAEIIPTGVYVIAGGRFRLVSDAFCRVTGYSRDELLALDPWRIVDPEDRSLVRQEAVKRLKSGETSSYHYRARAKDGRLIWVLESLRSVTFEGQIATLGSFFDATEMKQSAEALSESSAQLRFFAETSRDLIFIHRFQPQRKYEYVSPSSEQMLGFTPQDFYDSPDLIRRITVPDDLPLFNQRFGAHGTQDNPLRIRVVRKDGRVIWIDARVSYELDIQGKPVVGRGIIRDVTDIVQANRALRQSEQHFRTIAESSRDIIYRYRYLPEPGYEYVSPSVEAVYGYTPQDFYRNRSILTEIVHPDDRNLLAERRLRPGRGDQAPNVRIIRKDGKVIWIERNITQFRDESGALVAVQGIVRDITRRVEAEEALRKRSDIFRLLAENSNDMIYRYRMTLPYGYEYVSPASAAVFGYTPEEFYADPKMTQKLWPPDESEDIMNMMRDLTNNWQSVVHHARHKNGSFFWVEVSRRRVFDTAGSLIAVEGVIRNVTQRVEAEENLRKREALFRLLAENAHDMIYRFRAKPTRAFEYVSPACEQIFGYTPEDFYADPMLGRRLWPQADASPITGQYKVLSSNWETIVHKSLRKDGKEIWVEVTRQRLFDDDGSFAGVEGVIRDVTERMQQAMAIASQRTLLNRLVMATPDALVAADGGGGIILANRAFHDLFNREMGSLVGANLVDIVPIPELSDAFRGAVAARSHVTNIELRSKDSGGERYLIASIIPMPFQDSEGAPSQDLFLIILHDVTMERASQATLYHTSRLASIGEMAAGVAHEINNPLTSILGYSELMALSPDLPDPLRRDVQTIKANAERASHIVRNLLAFGRPHRLQRIPVNVNEALLKALELRTYELKASNIETALRLQDSLPLILGDPNQLQQVFFNIIINAEAAMLASHGKGTLTITTAVAGSKVTIAFADDGPGITPDIAAKIFDLFFTTKEPGKGTGLGLSISHTIVKAHDGDITAVTRPGQGATFLIILPAQQA